MALFGIWIPRTSQSVGWDHMGTPMPNCSKQPAYNQTPRDVVCGGERHREPGRRFLQVSLLWVRALGSRFGTKAVDDCNRLERRPPTVPGRGMCREAEMRQERPRDTSGTRISAGFSAVGSGSMTRHAHVQVLHAGRGQTRGGTGGLDQV